MARASFCCRDRTCLSVFCISVGHRGTWGCYSTAALHKEIAMIALSSRPMVLLFALGIALGATAHGQVGMPSPSATPAAWTIKLSGDIRWQQVTPAGALLVATDGALTAVDIEHGRIAWEKPELGGLPADSVRPIEGSLLMEAARQGLLVIFDPVTGGVVFDSRRLDLT